MKIKVGTYNATNMSRLTKGRRVSKTTFDSIDFDKNEKKFKKYLEAKGEFYKAHDDFILTLYKIFSKYENNGFSSSDFLALMGYSKRNTSKEDWNLSTLLSNIGRMNINSDQFNIYLETLLGVSSLTTEDYLMILEKLNIYGAAYAKFRPLDLENYQDQKKNAQLLREQKTNTAKFPQNPEQKFLYAITTAEKTETGTTAKVYFLEDEQMHSLLSDDLYFGVQNIVDQYGLLQYTRFGATSDFTPSVLASFPFQGQQENMARLLINDGQMEDNSVLNTIISVIENTYKNMENSPGSNLYGRAAEAALRSFFTGSTVPIQRGENDLGLRQGDIVINIDNKEYHVSVKNITDFNSQKYDEYKERQPEDMAYLFSHRKFFAERVGDTEVKESVANASNEQQSQEITDEQYEKVQKVIDDDPKVAEVIYDSGGVHSEIQGIMDTLN